MFKSGNVTLMVADMKKAVQFYVETLGLKLQYQVEGHWAQVETSGLTIGLHPISENGSPEQGKSESLSIGLEPEDFNYTFEILKSEGIVFANIIDEKATRLAYFTDPDGNPLYLFEIKPEASVPET